MKKLLLITSIENPIKITKIINKKYIKEEIR